MSVGEKYGLCFFYFSTPFFKSILSTWLFWLLSFWAEMNNIQCLSLNWITLGRHKGGKNNRIIQSNDQPTCFAHCLNIKMGPAIFDYNKHMIGRQSSLVGSELNSWSKRLWVRISTLLNDRWKWGQRQVRINSCTQFWFIWKIRKCGTPKKDKKNIKLLAQLTPTHRFFLTSFG